MSHVLQKAKIDGQLLDVTVDLAMLPAWKQEIIRNMVDIINNPDATEDERDMSRSTLADVFTMFEGLSRLESLILRLYYADKKWRCAVINLPGSLAKANVYAADSPLEVIQLTLDAIKESVKKVFQSVSPPGAVV